MLPSLFSLAEILVLADTVGAGRMAPPTSTRISAGMKCVQEHNSPVNVRDTVYTTLNIVYSHAHDIIHRGGPHTISVRTPTQHTLADTQQTTHARSLALGGKHTRVIVTLLSANFVPYNRTG